MAAQEKFYLGGLTAGEREMELMMNFKGLGV